MTDANGKYTLIVNRPPAGEAFIHVGEPGKRDVIVPGSLNLANKETKEFHEIVLRSGKETHGRG